METPVDYSTWIARCMEDIMKENQDVTIFCDNATSYRFGPVGAGKSNKAHTIIRTFDPFTPLRDILVPVDSIPAYQRILGARRRRQVTWIDEARWFMGKEFASVKRTKIFKAEMQTDRKLNQVRVVCDGSIFAMTDPLLYSGRFTWRYTSVDRNTAELWVWNGHVDSTEKVYGQYVATHEQWARVVAPAEREYDGLVLTHEHREDDCVSLM